jgi:flagellar basal-body rod modification protein FlgD
MQAAELVGREVLTEMDTVLLEEGSTGVSGVILVPDYTDGLNIQVRNQHGALVKTIDAGDYRDGDSNFKWDGTNEDGKPVNPGDYTISATAVIRGKQYALPVQTYNRVESITVDRASASVALHLQNRHIVSFAQVNQYR